MKIEKIIQFLFIINVCIITICILLRVFYLKPQILSGVEWNTDLTYFYDFIFHYPQLYSNETWGVYCVVYLPYFYWVFYPFTLFSEKISFVIISIITIISLFVLYMDAKKIDDIYALICQCCILFASFNVGLNGTLEVIILMVYTYLTKELYQNKFDTKDMALFGVFLFKILPIIYLLLFYNKMDKRKFKQFIIIIIITQFLLNIYFIIINPNLINPYFILEIIDNTNSAIKWYSNIWLTRCSFITPLIYIIYLKLIKNKWRFNNSDII